MTSSNERGSSRVRIASNTANGSVSTRSIPAIAGADRGGQARRAGALAQGVKAIAELQDRLYAQDRWSVLLVFQAIDAAGKDSVIKHVMSGINPQGCQVYSFKSPSSEDLDHDFLWRCTKALPERGRIGIFNRSYYEEMVVVRVHPESPRRSRKCRRELLKRRASGRTAPRHQQLRELSVEERHDRS